MGINMRGAWSGVVRFLMLVTAIGVLTGCASSFPSAPPAAADAEYNYVIGPGDTLNIVVWRNPELSMSVPVRPDGAFYVYIDVSATGLDAMGFCERALQQAHVALTPGHDFGVSGAGHFVRLSYAASREDLSEGLTRLGRFVRRLE